MIGSITVMAHKLRRHFVPLLLPRLPGAVVVWDEKNDRWDTGRRALLSGASNDDRWHLVIQDDALLCHNFTKQATLALTKLAERNHIGPVSLYLSKTAPFASAVDAATKDDASWIVAPGPLWGVGLLIRRYIIAELVEECDTMVDEPQYDLRIAKFFARRSLFCYYSVPSLVDHRIGVLAPSLIPGRGSSKRRTAEWFLGTRANVPIWNSRVISAGLSSAQLPG
jgi:hypothetical protein